LPSAKKITCLTENSWKAPEVVHTEKGKQEKVGTEKEFLVDPALY
jgi:hypothetical protein